MRKIETHVVSLSLPNKHPQNLNYVKYRDLKIKNSPHLDLAQDRSESEEDDTLVSAFSCKKEKRVAIPIMHILHLNYVSIKTKALFTLRNLTRFRPGLKLTWVESL